MELLGAGIWFDEVDRKAEVRKSPRFLIRADDCRNIDKRCGAVAWHTRCLGSIEYIPETVGRSISFRREIWESARKAETSLGCSIVVRPGRQLPSEEFCLMSHTLTRLAICPSLDSQVDFF